LEQYHFIDQLTFTYEVAIQEHQIFLACSREQLHPFNDEEMIVASLLIDSDIRYIKNYRPKFLLRKLLFQKTKAPVSQKKKGGSAANEDLIQWMTTGPLRPIVDEIEIPDFASKKEVDQLRTNPDYFLWSLLTFDLFKKRIIH
jgi:hypothetical protein